MQTISLLFKVLWSPSEVMFRLSKSPRVLAPMLWLCAFSFVSSAIVTIKVDPADLAVRAISQSPGEADLSADQKALVRDFALVSAALTPLLLSIVVTVVYFALFTPIGREAGFKAFFSITLFACVPLIFRQLASVVAAFVIPSAAITADKLGNLSPALFFSRGGMSPVLFAALSTLDLVSLWILALLTIGYGFVVRKTLSGATRSCAVGGVFLVYFGLRLTVAAVSGV
jgi:hypothetical protein